MCLMSTETTRLIREGGTEVGEEGDYIYLSLHCHHHHNSCIKMGINESHFNVSLIVMDKDNVVFFLSWFLCCRLFSFTVSLLQTLFLGAYNYAMC